MSAGTMRLPSFRRRLREGQQPTSPAPLRREAEPFIRRFRDVDYNGPFDIEQVTRRLTCGHECSGKPRKDGRYPCYSCRDGIPVPKWEDHA